MFFIPGNYKYLRILGVSVAFLLAVAGHAQPVQQVISGYVLDAESHHPVEGANLICETCNPVTGTMTDPDGFFRFQTAVGRHTIRISHISYHPIEMKDVQVTSGKAVTLNIELHELVIQTEDIAVRGTANRWINPMGTVSVRSLRSQDAARYAGGFFDPSRMVTNFAGVASANNDDKNEIIIRGNSPRGILWRIDGIEIPNPNHFATGQGSTSGGYTAITTDVLSSFDFFTGSFPAEYGNALSGVMDLNLRNGNTDKREYTVMLSVLGTEVSAEGPFRKNSGDNYLMSFRYADFSYLRILGIYTEEETGIIPRTMDWAVKTTFNTQSAGTFSFFSLGGNSQVGDLATASEDEESVADTDEYHENRRMTITGIKHIFNLKNNKSYIRNTLAHTWELTSDEDAGLDSTGQRTVTYNDAFRYSALRFASLFNHKINPGNSLRAGLTINRLSGDLNAKRLIADNLYDTLVDSRAGGWYGGSWMQWKHKTAGNLEINTGLHITWSGISREIIPEPRFGLILWLSGKNSFTLGSGIHSRHDPLSMYHYRIRVDKTHREEANSDLKTTKAFHLTTGFNHFFTADLHLNVEAYHQYLFDVPIRETTTGQFSLLNQSEGLPDVILANDGKGKNTGLEMTLEKSFSRYYYLLATASLFDSKYKAPDGYWYNTYYNTNYVFNMQSGVEFPLGAYHQNTLGVRLRGSYRGGFRYTPVNLISSLKNKRVVYKSWQSYGERLPDFMRLDLGLSYRLNRRGYALSFMADIQNVTDRRNILRRKFSYINKSVVTLNSKSIGMVPIISVRAEF